MEPFSQMKRACDPDFELVLGKSSEMAMEVPFLDGATALSLFDERSIWGDPHLISRCRAFATAVTVKSDALMSMLADADNLYQRTSSAWHCRPSASDFGGPFMLIRINPFLDPARIPADSLRCFSRLLTTAPTST